MTAKCTNHNEAVACSKTWKASDAQEQATLSQQFLDFLV